MPFPERGSLASSLISCHAPKAVCGWHLGVLWLYGVLQPVVTCCEVLVACVLISEMDSLSYI